MQLPLWILWLAVTFQNYVSGSGFKRVCYYGSWTNHLQSMDARFEISDIDPFLCTHVVFAFAKVNTDLLRLERQEKDDDNGQVGSNARGKFYDFTYLKSKNSKLKTLLSVGGETTSEAMHKVAETAGRRSTFAENCLIFLRDRNFDGLDIDWEYPMAFRDDFTELLKVMRAEFDKDAKNTGRPKLLLSIAGAAGKDKIDASYDVHQIIKYVDFINVMAYDYYGPGWSFTTGFTGPLFSRSSAPSYNQQLSQNWTMHYWIQLGVPPEKLVMGTTSQAVAFKLSDRNNHGIGAPIIGGSTIAGLYTKTAGHLAYYEVCRKGTQVWDDEQKIMYAYTGDEWYGFETPRSMTEKVKFARALGLGGVMFWILDRDDFTGRHCSQGKYPLLQALATAAENRTFTRAPTLAPTTPTTKSITAAVTSTKTPTLHPPATKSPGPKDQNTFKISTLSTFNSSKEASTSQLEYTSDIVSFPTTTERKPPRPAFIVFTTDGASLPGLSSVLLIVILFISIILQ